MSDRELPDKTAHAAVRAALMGLHDDQVRLAFIAHFHEQLDAFEQTIADVYSRWLKFEADFARDEDSATVVGALFTVIARAISSMKLLMLGQLTMSGSAQRQACEALASAFLFAERDWPYRMQSREGQFSVNKAVGLLIKRSAELGLDSKALQTLLQAQSVYSKFSHPTMLALADLVNLKGGGHHLGASFDPHKIPFYEQDLISRLGFASILVDAFDGIERQMKRWPTTGYPR
jgi:hypothetical protein